MSDACPTHSARLALASSLKEVCAGALRVLRYLLTSKQVFDVMLALRVDLLVTRCGALVHCRSQHVHSRTCVHGYIHAHTYTHAHMYAQIHAHAHVFVHALISKIPPPLLFVHVNTYISNEGHTHTHMST